MRPGAPGPGAGSGSGTESGSVVFATAEGGGPFRNDDPAAVERAGAALAELAAPYRPDAVVSPSGTTDVLLAHVVARTLRANRRVLVEDLGRLIVEHVRPGERTVVVTAGVGADGPGGPGADLTPLIRTVTGQGGRVVAVCSLTAPPTNPPRPEGGTGTDGTDRTGGSDGTNRTASAHRTAGMNDTDPTDRTVILTPEDLG